MQAGGCRRSAIRLPQTNQQAVTADPLLLACIYSAPRWPCHRPSQQGRDVQRAGCELDELLATLRQQPPEAGHNLPSINSYRPRSDGFMWGASNGTVLSDCADAARHCGVVRSGGIIWRCPVRSWSACGFAAVIRDRRAARECRRREQSVNFRGLNCRSTLRTSSNA